MKAKGVYVYGVWCPDCGWWTGFNPDKEVVKGSIREFHPCFTHHDAKIKRIYIAPPSSRRQTSEYLAWQEMLKRAAPHRKCPKRYARFYKDRGITVCDRWLKFENFLADMGQKPSKDYSLDRINNDGNYEPSNCRWATWIEQSRNTRHNRLITHDGKTLCLADWSKLLNIRYSTLWRRLSAGWPIDRAFNQKDTTP